MKSIFNIKLDKKTVKLINILTYISIIFISLAIITLFAFNKFYLHIFFYKLSLNIFKIGVTIHIFSIICGYIVESIKQGLIK